MLYDLKKNIPKNKILGARITGSDHLKGGIDINEAVFLSKKLKKLNKVFNNRVKYLGVVEGIEKMKLLKKTSIFLKRILLSFYACFTNDMHLILKLIKFAIQSVINHPCRIFKYFFMKF